MDIEKIKREYIKKINDLENKLKEEKNKNSVLNNKILELQKQLEEKRNIKSNKSISQNNLNNKFDKDKILELMEELRLKENELKEIKSKLPFELLKDERLMTVIFISKNQKVHYSLICKNTDPFSRLENELFKIKEYQNYKQIENYFIAHGKKINRYETSEENGIKNSDIITLIDIDEN